MRSSEYIHDSCKIQTNKSLKRTSNVFPFSIVDLRIIWLYNEKLGRSVTYPLNVTQEPASQLLMPRSILQAACMIHTYMYVCLCAINSIFRSLNSLPV